MMRSLLILSLLSLNLQAQELSFSGKRITADSLYIGLTNNIYAPCEITFTAKVAYKGQVRGSDNILIRPKDSVAVIGVVPLGIIKDTANVKIMDFFDFKGTVGDSNTAKHDDSYRYLLPYKKGKRIKIIQSFGGNFSHNTVKSRYAIDFGTQVGDTIFAAREGTVVKTKADSKQRGGRDMIDQANEILIIHSDGTIAYYVHLDYEGVLVEPGQRVARGQAIGISGFTGFTTTPHLHFVVREPKNISVPIYFENLPERALKKGKRYRH